jgi:hypothetical protein
VWCVLFFLLLACFLLGFLERLRWVRYTFEEAFILFQKVHQVLIGKYGPVLGVLPCTLQLWTLGASICIVKITPADASRARRAVAWLRHQTARSVWLAPTLRLLLQRGFRLVVAERCRAIPPHGLPDAGRLRSRVRRRASLLGPNFRVGLLPLWRWLLLLLLLLLLLPLLLLW